MIVGSRFGSVHAAFALAALSAIAVACSDSSSSGDGASSGSAGSAGADAASGGASGSGAGGTSPGGSGNAGSGGSVPSAGGTGGAQGGSAGNTGSGGNAGSAGSDGGTGGSGGSPSTCDPSLSESTRTAVAAALDALFVDKQTSAIDQYWADPYLQHNPVAESGVDTFKSFMIPFVTSSGFSYERIRTFAECDLAVVQGRYSGTGVIFDMFRLSDGKLVEHWDSDSGQASDASGPTEITNPGATASSRAVVLDFLGRLIDGDAEGANELIADGYTDHRSGYLDAVANGTVSYSTVHHVIADGEFVFTLSEGELQGTTYGFYDLFRLENGKLAEHWDSRRVVPGSTASGLGIF